MNLLEALAAHPAPANLKMLAAATRLHPSTAHRILNVMVRNRMVERIEHGQGRPDDLAKLDNVAESIMGRTICALGEAAATPVLSFIKHFRPEFEYYIQHGKSMVESQ